MAVIKSMSGVVGLRRWMFYVIVYQEDIIEVVREDMEFLFGDLYALDGY